MSKQFKLDLFQVERVHTETFTVEAKDQADAQKQADAIAKDKDIKTKFDWEINEVVAEQPASDQPTSPAPEPVER